MKPHLVERARAHFIESGDMHRAVAEQCLDSVLAAAKLVAESFESGGKVLICGNGGSAADSQHMATEFVSRLTKDFERPGLPAIALTTDTSFLTAFANDYGFEDVFARQVLTLGKPGDVLIGISTSGGSENVNRAVASARQLSMGTIALTGRDGLKEETTVTIAVPSDNTQYVQEAHQSIEHVICDLVEQQLFVKAER